jgi:ATP-binding cassette subfamily B protein
MGRAIDDYITQADLAGLARMLGLMLLTYIVASLGTWLQTYLLVGIAQYAVRDIRKDLFARLQTLPVKFFDQRAHGDLMSRLTNDVENISNILATSFSQFLSSVLSLVGVVIFMFALNAMLATITLIVMPVTFFLTRAISRRTRAGFREMQQTLGGLNGIIEETITGERTVKAFVREQDTVKEFSVVNRKLQKVALRARVLVSFMGPLMNMVNNIGLAVVACSGGWLAVQGLATVGEIAAFVGYAGRLSWPLNQIAQLFNSIQSALAGAERVFDLMDQVPEVDALDAKPFAAVKGDVVLTSVDFAYDPQVPVLQDVSLEASAGQMIALVGPTGAGKTKPSAATRDPWNSTRRTRTPSPRWNS